MKAHLSMVTLTSGLFSKAHQIAVLFKSKILFVHSDELFQQIYIMRRKGAKDLPND